MVIILTDNVGKTAKSWGKAADAAFGLVSNWDIFRWVPWEMSICLFSIVFFPFRLRKKPQKLTYFPTLETKLNPDLEAFIKVLSAKHAFLCWSERRSITWTSTCKWSKVEMKIQVNQEGTMWFITTVCGCVDWSRGWVDRWDMQLKELGYKMIGLPWWLRW